MEITVPVEVIERKIFFIRGHKVMLDADLAELYGVTVKRLNEQVKRNLKRFPPDFMFQMTKQGWGHHRKYLPYVFTEQGVAMLSSVLNSERAIEVNVHIMRAFVKLREMIASNKELARKLDALENKYDAQFKVVFDAIRQFTPVRDCTLCTILT
jgi:hypothetical protein